ncbi:MAG: hypothetical protein E7170_01180 [Firmicutes bacterium]|nr:hypothetical protein [Bacillota bacterium]
MTKYFYYLLCQFNSSKGIDFPNIFSNDYLNEFVHWLYEQRKVMEELQKYFEYYEIDINSSNVAEVGKGKYDSIALPKTKIISPFGETLNKENKELVIYQGEPFILGSEFKGQVVDRFMTHNPYCYELIKKWPLMHFNGYDIIIGYCGFISDLDRNNKLKQISLIKDAMSDECICSYDVINGMYVCFMKSKRKTKKMIKTF